RPNSTSPLALLNQAFPLRSQRTTSTRRQARFRATRARETTSPQVSPAAFSRGPVRRSPVAAGLAPPDPHSLRCELAFHCLGPFLQQCLVPTSVYPLHDAHPQIRILRLKHSGDGPGVDIYQGFQHRHEVRVHLNMPSPAPELEHRIKDSTLPRLDSQDRAMQASAVECLSSPQPKTFPCSCATPYRTDAIGQR